MNNERRECEVSASEDPSDAVPTIPPPPEDQEWMDKWHAILREQRPS